MGQWFEDDSFWEVFAPYMFSDQRLDAAKAEVESLIGLLGLSPGARVLDLCCGVGRHSIEFARRGYVVTGVDRTKAYLERASRAALGEHLDIELVQSDMRSFARPGAFDGAVSMFTSFGYFEDAAEESAVLRNLCTSLRGGGRLVIDVNGKEVLARKFTPGDWREHPDGAIVMEQRKILDDWGRVESRWILLRGNDRREATLTVRLYSGAEMRSLMIAAGFREVALFGSLAGIPYDNGAERLIAVATK